MRGLLWICALPSSSTDLDLLTQGKHQDEVRSALSGNDVLFPKVQPFSATTSNAGEFQLVRTLADD